MSDQMKMALMQGQQATPRPNGMGMLAPDTQGLPPPVAKMQGGYGLNPQMLGLLQQVAGQQKMSAPPMQSPFSMTSRPVQQAARLPYGPGNWSR